MNWQERIDRDRKKRTEEMIQRRRRDMWAAKHRARVIHPDFGEVVVPCYSPLGALLCAAELWGTTSREIADKAEVRAV